MARSFGDPPRPDARDGTWLASVGARLEAWVRAGGAGTAGDPPVLRYEVTGVERRAGVPAPAADATVVGWTMRGRAGGELGWILPRAGRIGLVGALVTGSWSAEDELDEFGEGVLGELGGLLFGGLLELVPELAERAPWSVPTCEPGAVWCPPPGAVLAVDLRLVAGREPVDSRVVLIAGDGGAGA